MSTSRSEGASGALAPTSDQPGESGSVARSGIPKAARIAEAYAFPALTLALILFFSVLPQTSGTFATSANWQVILSGQAVPLLIALAVLVPVITNVWDFTPGALAGFACVLSGKVVASTGSIPLAVAVAIGVGLGVGIVNAVLVVKLKINSVIATLGMTIVIAGVIQLITEGVSLVSGIPVPLTDFGSGKTLGIPNTAIVAVLIAAGVAYVVRRTPFGRYMFAVGSNRKAAGLVGLRVDGITMSAFILGGMLAGCAGALLLAQSGAANPNVGPDFTLSAYAAVFLGAVAINPGHWNVGGVVVAVVFLGVLSSGLVLAGASAALTDIVNGVALLAGVGVANLIARQRGRDVTVA